MEAVNSIPSRHSAAVGGRREGVDSLEVPALAAETREGHHLAARERPDKDLPVVLTRQQYSRSLRAVAVVRVR